MKGTLFGKIVREHLEGGSLEPGVTALVRVDQVLLQDATGTMAWLEFEAMGIERIKTPLAVTYIDHNLLQTGFMNADDHAFLQSASARYGAHFSRPGNGICHQVHLERFSAPGGVLIGTDSHTPTGGGVGMAAIGVGGLDAAATLAGRPLRLTVPKVVKVNLTGKLNRPWTAATDVSLEILRRLTVKGGVGKVMEYTGPGVADLSATERATITNFGAELGATTSIFPSDERTREYLAAQGREEVWKELHADPDAEYDEEITVDLSALGPMLAEPWSPDRVVPLSEHRGERVDQVCIGSCTNSSYPVMAGVAAILRGRTVAPGLALTLTPGSKQVFTMMAKEGLLTDIISAGGRVLESGCGPCIGMGQAPPSGGVSVRSFNRNFKGRSGTRDAEVFLANPFICALIALKGQFAMPDEAGFRVEIPVEPESFTVNDNLLIPPPSEPVELVKGPNIKEVPLAEPPPDELTLPVILKTGDNVTTDDVMPAGSRVLPFRSNIPKISEFVFEGLAPGFHERAKELGRFCIIAGENYGQGSSREHAAIAPMYLGLRAVLAKSFARIHRANLINFGVLPLVFADPADYERVEEEQSLNLTGIGAALRGKGEVRVVTGDVSFEAKLNASEEELEILRAGGLLALLREGRGGA